MHQALELAQVVESVEGIRIIVLDWFLWDQEAFNVKDLLLFFQEELSID